MFSLYANPRLLQKESAATCNRRLRGTVAARRARFVPTLCRVGTTQAKDASPYLTT